jgi:hypothetical protein
MKSIDHLITKCASVCGRKINLFVVVALATLFFSVRKLL